MKPGDVVMIYRDPMQRTAEAGQATLIEKVKDYLNMEEWLVSYINRPCTQCRVLIKKEDEKDKTEN